MADAATTADTGSRGVCDSERRAARREVIGPPVSPVPQCSPCDDSAPSDRYDLFASFE